ncbi:M23 family metallopeptidase [Nocardia shimofusensis]|uniref:M23 family metallopeptidase n=1 Tax=Nocardia shimofusensis TaxID=228596 RepID=UPI000831CE40|nr:M23 family metallopeptidase [Nocardia shimofusensis]
MSVTDLLSTFRPSTARSRRRVTGRALALTAALGVSLTVVNAVGPDETGTASAAAIADTNREVVDAEGNMVEFTAFTPREAQMPQIVPEAVLWEQHRLAVEAARPKTVRPVAGVLTSTFGARWGAMHAGLDFGDPIGAPIAAVTDGVVIEAGPASGFGLWVRVQQDDGTVGVYGHMNDILVSVGQPVRAGDVIATVGNRGYSTGPHLHFEVHVPGIGPIDPAGWLGARGIDVHH